VTVGATNGATIADDTDPNVWVVNSIPTERCAGTCLGIGAVYARGAVVTGWHQMRNGSALFMTLLTLYGCNAHDGHVQQPAPDLEHLATGLQEAWPGSTYLVQMTITIRQTAGHEFLHCRLWNRSPSVLELDRSDLPWVAPGLRIWRHSCLVLRSTRFGTRRQVRPRDPHHRPQRLKPPWRPQRPPCQARRRPQSRASASSTRIIQQDRK
jgi:hypothetical protein